jgi:hypothetical protein
MGAALFVSEICLFYPDFQWEQASRHPFPRFMPGVRADRRTRPANGRDGPAQRPDIIVHHAEAPAP